MENIDIPTQPLPVRRRGDAVWNVLTFVVLIATMCVVGAFVLIYANPYMAFNPFPPPTPIPSPVPPTPTEFSFPPTWTPTSLPSATEAPPSDDATPEPPSASGENAAPPSAPEVGTDYPFVLMTDPAYVASTLINPSGSCDWLGVAGQAFDLKGTPVLGLLVNVGGALNAETISLTGLTGTVTTYGDGGYELALASRPAASSGAVWIQLADQSNVSISDKVYFDTSDGCDQNLILINFKQVR